MKPKKCYSGHIRTFIFLSLIISSLLASFFISSQSAAQQTAEGKLLLTDAERAWLAKHPRIEMGVMDAWPPLNYLDQNNKPQGIGIDYLSIINKRLGNALVPVPAPFKKNYDRVINGKLDALMDITWHPDRDALFNFTRPYIVIPHVIIGRKGDIYFRNEKDLIGKTIAIEKGFYNVIYFKKNHPSVIIHEFDSTSAALDAVSRGEAEAYAGNRAVAIYLIEKELLNNLRLMGKLTESKSSLQFGVQKQQPLLASILDKALASITVDEERAIRQKWLQEGAVSLELSIQEKAWLKNHPVIKVASDPIWAPVEFIDRHGIPQGISADYVQKIGEMLGVRFEIAKGQDWQNMVAGVQQHELDIFSSVVRTEQRETYAAFTDSYLSLPIGIFNQQDAGYIASMDELAGKKVAVVKGHGTEFFLRSKHPEVQLAPAESIVYAIRQLSEGKVYAFVDSPLTTGYYLRKLGITNIKLAGETPYRYDLSMGVRKDWPQLIFILNKAIRTIPESERNDIYNKWSSIQHYPSVNYALIWKIVAGALVVVAMFVFWNRRLGKEIAIRKQAQEKLKESQQELISIVFDLNQKKAELEEANNKLKELDQLKSMFIASMSHELRTPLNSIIGFTGIILQGMTGEINSEQKDQLQRVLRAGKHLLALITDVIDISKIEAGKIEAYSEEFPLDILVKDALSELKLQIKEKGLEVEVSTAPIRMKTDRKRLFQCVLNYLSNAVKYTEKGKISLVTEKKGDILKLDVTDTGIGIKEEDLPKLFNSFVRLDSPLKMTVSGTGLGLYLTKKLVTEVLGGEVSVTSTYGKGSTFTLCIPMHLRKKLGNDTLAQ